MGSERSSRWGSYRRRATVEEALAWDVNAWARQEELVPGRSFVGTLVCPSLSGSLARADGIPSLMRYCADLRDRDYSSVQVTYEVAANRVSTDDTILLGITACNYGGYRLWFRCPICGHDKRTRCTRLYIPPGRHSFGCRQCYGLVYRSSQQSRHPSRVEPVSLAEWQSAGRALDEGPLTRDQFRRLGRAIRGCGIR